MKKKKSRSRLQWLLILLVLLITLTAYVSGKYIKNISFNGSVTFTTSLVSNMVLQEHEAVQNPDGSYRLTDKIVNSNSYTLIPGQDIPKDPHIIITGKTQIPAYLYIEIESTLDAPVTYEVDTTKWILLKTNGNKSVYYYKDVLGEGFTEDPIYILKDGWVRVSQKLLSGSDAASDVLTIRAVLKERVGAGTAENTYNRDN